MKAEKTVPPDETAALHDLRDAIGQVRPLRPEHVLYLETLGFSLAVARRAARQPRAWEILAKERAFLLDELRGCGVSDDVIRGLIFGEVAL
jgi:hypothetical protein